MNTTTVRAMTAGDLPAVMAIYNHYVAVSTCTYQTEPDTAVERASWFAAHGERHPLIIAETGGAVVGWASLTPFHRRQAYARTVENSVYVDHRHHRRGIGRRLLDELIVRAGAIGHHAIIANISADQEASIRLHAGTGFRETGHVREVGHKFGRWLDVVFYQLLLV